MIYSAITTHCNAIKLIYFLINYQIVFQFAKVVILFVIY